MARKKRAVGGKVHVMNGKGSPILEAGMKTKGTFKRGGATKEDVVGGEKSEPRMDKRARGGRAITSKGGSPYSSGGSFKSHDGKSESGHECESL